MTLYNNALSEFLGRYQSDDNEWWRLEQGEAQNMFDAAVESIARLGTRAERAEAERDAALAEVARLQRLKAVAVDIANDREHNEKRLEAEVARLQEAARALYETFYVDDDGGAFVYWITKPKYAETFAAAFGIDTD